MRENGLRYLKPNERAALSEFVERLQQGYAEQIRQVVLFGSKARGDFDGESDLDVFVLVADDDWRLHDQVTTLGASVSIKYSTLISPKTFGPTLHQKMRRFRSLLLDNIRKEGVVLWTRQAAKRSSRTSPIAATN